jgi:hypothetical protein
MGLLPIQQSDLQLKALFCQPSTCDLRDVPRTGRHL